MLALFVNEKSAKCFVGVQSIVIKGSFLPVKDDDVRGHLRQLRTHSLASPPHPRLLSSVVVIILDKVPKMVFKGLVIGFLHALHNLDDDGREAVAVEVDFLVVGDLADVARKRQVQSATCFR